MSTGAVLWKRKTCFERMLNVKIRSIDIVRDYKKVLWLSVAAIVIFKCVLMGLFSSDYQDKMFIPFVRTWLEQHVNPYDYYYHNHLLSSFPYPPLMLFIEGVGGGLLQIFHPDSIFWTNFLFKVPLLAFDLLGLWFVQKIEDKRFKYALVLYFASPINLFAIFMHGQLDIIPTTFLVIALYYLIYGQNNRDMICFSIFLAMALGTKLHILVAVPLLYVYLFRRKGWKATFFSGGIVVACLLGILVPFWGQGLIQTVLLNQEQSIVTQVFFDYGTTKVIIPVLAIALIYLKIIQLNYINRQLLLSVLGVLFAIFLVCVPPMPGWFVWIVPFVALYFKAVSENKYKMLTIYLLFNIAYLFYFLCCHQTDFVDIYILGHSLQALKIDTAIVCNVGFTLMTACLIILLAEMYILGVASNSLYKRRNLPFTIGIAGDSGTGKSELLNSLEKILGGSKQIQYIEGDGDHRWQRGSAEWEQYTHLDPKANYLYRQAKDIMTLREGSIVRRVDYDHKTGTFTQSKRIEPRPFIVLCGLHSLYLPQTRKALDLKIYMDTDETLRRFWKIQRDCGKRGYTNESIMAQIEKRIPDAKHYIYPQKQFADLCIHYFDRTLTDCCDLDHQLSLSLELMMNIAVDLEPIVGELAEKGFAVQHQYCDDMKHQSVVFDGETTEAFQTVDFSEIALHQIPQFEELFPHPIHWENGLDGLLQLFVLVMICAKMRGET